MKLLPATRLFFKPPGGTEAWKSTVVLDKFFPRYDKDGSTIVVFHDTQETVDSNYSRDILGQIRDRFNDLCGDNVIEIVDRFSLAAAGCPGSAAGLTSADMHSTLLIMYTKDQFTPAAQGCAAKVDGFLRGLPLRAGAEVLTSGPDMMLRDFMRVLLQELLQTDSITATIALSLFVAFVCNPALLLLPLLHLLCGICLSFAAMYCLTFRWQLPTFVPAVAASLMIALNIDWQFFLLLRYRRELGEGAEPEQAALRAIRCVGKVVLVSGTTLAISFVGMAALGIAFLAAMGVACSVSLVITMLCNLTLGPALLLAFPRFLGAKGCGRWSSSGRSVWYRLAAFATTKEGATVLIAASVAFMVPVICGLRFFQYVDTTELVFTRAFPSVQTMDFMSAAFAPGLTLPHYLTATRAGGVGPDLFDEAAVLLPRLVAASRGGLNASSIVSFTMLDGQPISWAESVALALASPDYRYLLSQTYSVVGNESAAAFELMLTFNPTEERVNEVVAIVRGVLREWAKGSAYEWTYGGLAVSIVDVAAEAYGKFALMLVLTLGVVWLFVAVMMRSLVLPVRLVLTLSVTVAWTFGLGSWIFCMGTRQGIYWFVPLMVTSVVVGLGVDYDIFLLARVTELREEGMTADEAIREGYDQTGSVITGAGVIMAIALAGLATSALPILREIGVFLCTSVLLDTFCVRMCFVPGILHLLGRWNWWPSALWRSEPEAEAADRLSLETKKFESLQPSLDTTSLTKTAGPLAIP